MEIIYIVLIVVVILIIVIPILLKKYINKKKAQRQSLSGVPEEIIEQFNLAEKMLADGKGEKTPYEIMWEISRKHNDKNFMKGGKDGGENTTERRRETTNTRRNNSSTVPEQSTTETGELPGVIERRQDIQDGTAISDDSSDSSDKLGESNIKGNFFSRFKRK